MEKFINFILIGIVGKYIHLWGETTQIVVLALASAGIIAAAYLLGSLNFAIIISARQYKQDIRNFGSKNLGGGNAGRVLGKKAGVAVMTMDILKVAFAIAIASFMEYTRFLNSSAVSLSTSKYKSILNHSIKVFVCGSSLIVMYSMQSLRI